MSTRLLNNPPVRSRDIVTVIKPRDQRLRTAYHDRFVGRVGKVVSASIDNDNNWVIDLEIDGVVQTSFRPHHIMKGLVCND